MKNLGNLVSGITLVAACFLFSQTASAQAKPKGKEWKVAEAAAKVKSTVKSDDAAISAGRDIWNKECKSCHGAKGLGDGAKAAKIDISCGDFSSDEYQNQTDGELFSKTVDGRKPMPSFKEKLSKTECWQVIAFTRTLKKK